MFDRLIIICIIIKCCLPGLLWPAYSSPATKLVSNPLHTELGILVPSKWRVLIIIIFSLQQCRSHSQVRFSTSVLVALCFHATPRISCKFCTTCNTTIMTITTNMTTTTEMGVPHFNTPAAVIPYKYPNILPLQKLEALFYQMLKTAQSYFHLYRHNTRTWWTDGRTDRNGLAITAHCIVSNADAL